jgi:hypothetical protein
MRRNRARFKEILDEDKDLERWYNNLRRGSETTANEQVRVLVRYLEHFKMAPSELISKAKADRKAVEDQLDDFITEMTDQGRKSEYLRNYVKVIRSYLNYHDIALIRKIKFSKSSWEPTDDKVPTQDELRKLIMASPLRAQTTEIFIAHTGVRPQVLGNHNGNNGLRLKHILDLEVENNKVSFKNMPALVTIPAELSKTSMKYHTFLSTEGCEILKTYLEGRVANTHEELGPESPVITISKVGYNKMGRRKHNKNYGSFFIETQNITREVRQAWKTITDKPPRPYVLRSYFDTRLMLAESQGKISHAYRQHFMGHKGDIEHTYTLNKNGLPDDVIQDMRRTYIACESYLTTEKSASNVEDIKEMLKKQWVQQAEMYGIKIEDIQLQVQNEKLDIDEEIRLIQEEIAKVTAPQQQDPGTIYKNSNDKQHKIVKENDLVPHLNKGWEMERELSNGKFLIRK